MSREIYNYVFDSSVDIADVETSLLLALLATESLHGESQERSALKRYGKEQEEKRRWEYYGSIPKKHWCEMSGRAVQVINRQGATGHVVDYGRTEVASEDLGVEQAIMVAMREFRDQVEHGWPIAKEADAKETGDDISHRTPDQVWIDAGYMTDVVYKFCRESEGSRFRPAVGRGAAQQRRHYYSRPTKTSS
jgi:hypothetical protein